MSRTKRARQKRPLHVLVGRGERVIAVVPQRAAGPGWANAPTWVYIATNDGRLREECIQPDERTPELHALYAAGEAMCNALLCAVPTTKVPNALAKPTTEPEA